jgi:predicted Zn finger-like uncharacterized protein
MMSLATRCSSCGTVFRVAQDQLKISEGWVRCGRCDAVFNALEGLFDLGRELPAEWDESAAPATPATAATPTAGALRSTEENGTAAPAAGSIFDLPGSAIDGLLADPIDAHLFRKRGAEGDGSPAAEVDARDRLEFSDARFDSDLFAENTSLADTTLVEVLSTGAGDLPLESQSQQPDFLRRADRRARWRSAPARFALVTLSVLAALTLAMQIAHHFRDAMAAQWPATRPVLAAWCRSAGCAIEAPRGIDDLTVESTALTRAIGLDAFVLSVTLRSRSRLALAMPSIDLSLTDGNGRLVARRALSPRDFGAASVLAPGAEAGLQVMLNAGNFRVAGYTVEIFYP